MQCAMYRMYLTFHLLLLVRSPWLIGRVVAVSLDLERPARAAQLGAHLFEQSAKWGHVLAGTDQAGAQLVAGVVAASGKRKRKISRGDSIRCTYG